VTFLLLAFLILHTPLDVGPPEPSSAISFGGSMADLTQGYDLQFYGESGSEPLITIILEGPHAGEVKMRPGLSLSEASRTFWEAIGKAYPDVCKVRD
jgi:hypothetical protein